MSTDDGADNSAKSPLAGVEQSLIDEFLRRRGYDAPALAALPEDERQVLLSQASTYASLRLMEMEAKARYARDLQDLPPH